MSSKDTSTRTRILEATIRILEEQRGRGVRMGDIAREAGVSRQAVYLHFASRTQLLVAATKYLDEVLDLDRRLARSRAAGSGVERLALFIEFWGNYVPEIYAVARALLMLKDADEAAAAAWEDRMHAMRDGCRAAIGALRADGRLAPEWTPSRATDALSALLLVPTWEHLTGACRWSTRQYVSSMTAVAMRTFVDRRE